MTDNMTTVAAIYEAFGRGDVPAILAFLADDVRWEPSIRDTGLPYLRERLGKDDVAGFFADLMANVELDVFQPEALCDGGDVVAVPVLHAGRVVGGDEVPPTREVHLWRFGPDGKVAEFQHVFDYTIHEQAAAGRSRHLQGATLRVLGDTVEVRQAGGRFEIFELTAPEGSGPPPHAHPWDEAYLGIEGELTVTVDGIEHSVGPGATVTAPAGCLHTYRAGVGGARFTVITSGHRASLFFADVDANTEPGAPTPESLPAVVEVAMRNGLTSPLFA